MSFDLLETDLKLFRQKEFVEEIERDAREKPVIFFNSYDKASVFAWYSDQKINHSYNGSRFRKNQFNLWTQDSVYHDQEVYFVGTHFPENDYKKYHDSYFGSTKLYKPSDNIEVEIEQFRIIDSEVLADIIITNPYKDTLNFQKDYHLTCFYFKNNKVLEKESNIYNTNFHVLPKSTSRKSITWQLPKNQYPSELGISASSNTLPDGPIYHLTSMPE